MSSKPTLFAIASIILGLVIIIGGIVFSMRDTAGPLSPDSNTATSTPISEDVPSDRNIVVTEKDDNSTITLKKGEAFLLQLGDMDWRISISDEHVVARVNNIATTTGMQGVYRALKSGSAVLAAEGRPHCPQGMMCAQYIVDFKVTIVVE